MEPSLDDSLLCAEDNSAIFDDDGVENMGFENFNDDGWNHRNYRTDNKIQSFYGEDEALICLSMQSEEFLAEMIEKECQHLPASDYLDRFKSGDLDLVARNEVIDWILKVNAHFNFGPLCLYSSINYLDRFLSAYELLSKAWMMQLLAVACVSLASKMEETEVPLSLDLQVGQSKFVFRAKTIQTMELIVLSTLEWRMQAITPFSFVDNFIKKISDDQICSRPSITKATQLILGTIKGIEFLEFRPSEIAAAAAAISVAGEIQGVDTEKAIYALIQHVQKDKVIKCVKMINKLSSFEEFIKGPTMAAPSVPQSPIGVLDAACLSYDTSVGSCANSAHSTPVAKRRKLVDL